jgi:hypothetical protein
MRVEKDSRNQYAEAGNGIAATDGIGKTVFQNQRANIIEKKQGFICG